MSMLLVVMRWCISSPAADASIGVIRRACQECGYVMLVTADHGNAERMIDEAGKPVTKHTTFRGEEVVPCFHETACSRPDYLFCVSSVFILGDL